MRSRNGEGAEIKKIVTCHINESKHYFITADHEYVKTSQFEAMHNSYLSRKNINIKKLGCLMFLICDMFTFVLFAFHHLSFFLFNFISHYAILCFSYTISPYSGTLSSLSTVTPYLGFLSCILQCVLCCV